ncbi:histidine phosphatase family protein [Oleidesulfovibrio sp.]|uniref:histidine phosphatase family protein n=1 Tax=Oleidesulfovibrio sp. TaxID=2909707 RepID=UPI003A8AC8FE
MIEFLVIRHASTTWNEEKRIQGHTDTPLSELGIEQTREWAESLRNRHWDKVISSDLQRTFLTAKAVNDARNIPIKTDPRLREQDWGKWVGMTIKEMREKEPDEVDRQEKAGWNFCPPGGEVRSNVLKRSLESLNDAAAEMAQQKNNGSEKGTILVVTHLGVIKGLISHFLDDDFSMSKFNPIEKRALHRFCWENGKLSLLEFNGPL